MKDKEFSLGGAIGLALSFMLGVVIVFYLSSPPQISLDKFVFTTTSGEVVSESDLAGKYIVVNFWATWCGPCIKEMPGLERAIQKLQNGNVVFLVASNDPLDKIYRFKQKKRLGIELYHVEQKDSPFGIRSLPTTYIFDKTNSIVYNRVGAFQWDDERVIEKLKKLLH